MADFVGIDAAAKTITDALDRHVPKILAGISGLVTSIGTITNTAVDKIDVAVKTNVDNLAKHVDDFAHRLPAVSVQISIGKSDKEIE